MRVGDYVRTPRFLNVRISQIFESEMEAWDNGFKEPTHYWDDPNYGIVGKSLGINRMEFAAFKKGGEW